MRTSHRSLLFCFCLAVLPNYLFSGVDSTATQAAPDERMDARLGVFLGGNLNRPRVNFYEIPGLGGNLTPYYEGNGFGGCGGFIGELPIFPWLHLDARASVVQHNVSLLSVPESTPVGSNDGNSDIGKFQRVLDVQLATAGLQLFLGISPVQNLNIFLGARGDLFFLKRYDQIEKLLEPSYGRFDDGLKSGNYRTRNPQGGVLPSVRAWGVANLSVALMGGIGYELPVNAAQSLTIAPEFFYSRGLTNVISAQDVTGRDIVWQLDNIHASVAFRWYPARATRFNAEAYQLKKLQTLEKEIAQERRKIQSDLRELRSSGLSVRLNDVKGILADGKQEIANPTVRVEEFRATKQHQMLPYIFFNENSSVIPGRYRRLTANERINFRLDPLEKAKPVEVYYTLLNIVGKRMETNPAAILFVTGCNSNFGAEQGNQRLSEQRAQAVSDYLQDVWKIQAKRIIVQKRDLPEKPSIAAQNLTAEEALAENRRVELSSTTPDILAPVSFETVQLAVNPPTLRLGLNILAGPGLKQWSLEISTFEGREDRVLHAFTGGNTYPEQYTWNIDADQRNIPTSPGSMDIHLGITDVDNRDAEAPIISVPVEVIKYADKKRTKAPDKRIIIYTIGFFDSDSQAETLLQSIKSRLTPQATVALDSYSGAARLQAFQQKLGAPNDRARVSKDVQDRILSLLKSDPTLPEGRFYNRSIRVEVQEAVQ
jgi:outer membrane protein OmpA-like peptidoglycan-associated protein